MALTINSTKMSLQLLLLFTLLSMSFAVPDIRQNVLFNSWLPGGIGTPNLKGKAGFGTCPVVAPVEAFDIHRILGTWYIHYHHEPSSLTFKCGKWELTRFDGDVEGIPCRIKLVASAVDATTGQNVQLGTYSIYLNQDDENNLQMIKSMPGRSPVNWYLVKSEDISQLQIYGCEEFPGDDVPVKVFYQHNYILRRFRTAIEPDVIDTVLRPLYAKYGIDFDSFIKMDQETCEEDPVIEPRPNAYNV